MRRFVANEDIAFVAVQTTFEGFEINDRARARDVAERYELTIPVGQSGADGVRSPLMASYRTGGTPWIVIIDRAGIVRYNDYHIAPQKADTLISSLLAEAPPAAAPATTAPPELLGSTLDLSGVQWAGDAAPALADRVTVMRWFTDGCPHCAASVPALVDLGRAYADRNLQTVAIYHPKPAGAVPVEQAVHFAAQLGFTGPVGVDPQWTVLRRLYLDAHPSAATSITLVIDRQGTVRHVHPGPGLYPSDDPARRREDRDFAALRTTIEGLLDAK